MTVFDSTNDTCTACGQPSAFHGYEAHKLGACGASSPQADVRGLEFAMRKAGQVAIDRIIDTGVTYEATADDLADYLTRIVDACVRAATEGSADA